MENLDRELRAAEGYYELGMADEALTILRGLSPHLRGELRARNLLVCLQVQAKDWAGAAETAHNLVHDDPEDAQHWIHLAYAVRRRDCVTDAEKILRRAIQIHPREWCIRYNLACYAAVQGRKDEARALLEEAVALEPNCAFMAREDPDLITLHDELS